MHAVFLSFVYFSHQASMMYLNSMSRLVFVIKAQSFLRECNYNSYTLTELHDRKCVCCAKLSGFQILAS